MKKKLKILIITFAIIFILVFFIQITYKNIKDGNNIIKSENDLIEYILNISSYQAKLEVIINSNKTTNKYVLEQHYLEPNYSKQIVNEPSNIQGIEIIYNGSNLEVRNTNLGLSKIYENYNYLNENILWLNYFISNCNSKGYTTSERDDELILETKIENYNYQAILYINQKTSLPSKMEILDNDNKSKVYIEYKEIKLNNIQENNIFAFITKDIRKEV